MDSNDRRSFEGDRRPSTRRSLRLSNASAQDDDYDLNALLVSDGFRPPDDHDGPSFNPNPPQSHTHQTPPHPQPPSTPLQQLAPAADVSKGSPGMRNRPSSVSKPPRSHDSLALRNDGTNEAGFGQAGASRVSSMSSDSPVLRMDSPYRGPSGPSHPYQMYPQRTLSVATTSTITAAPLPERAYTGPRGPTHPYALYTQSTVPNGGTTEQQSIPLGFTGVGDTYQRRLGPEGEESAGLIGPLGHTEELPPYTRYPEVAFAPKSPEAEAQEQTTPSPESQPQPQPQLQSQSQSQSQPQPQLQLQTQSPSQPPSPSPSSPSPSPSPLQPPVALSSAQPLHPGAPIAGAGGIGIATRDPEFSSTDDVGGMSRTRPSVRSNSSQNSQHDINTAASDVAEKQPVNKWQRRGKKKLCGIVPYWAICLLVVGMVIMGAIMGAVLGTVLAKHKPPRKGKDDEYSVRPSPTTADVEPLATIPADLFPIATGLYGLPPLDTSQAPKSCFNDTTQAQAWSCEMPFSYYHMDVELIPNVTSTAKYQLTLTAINDTNAKFIWGTQPPNVLDPVPLRLVNDTFEPARGPAWWLKMTYNKTVIVSEENFNAKNNNQNSRREYVPRGSGLDFSGEGDLDFSPSRFKKKNLGAKIGDTPWICTWPDTTLEIFIYPNQNTSLPYASATTGEDAHYKTSADGATAANPTASSNVQKKAYPRVLKMLERRLSNNPISVPSCRKVEVVDNGEGGVKTANVLDADQNPIDVVIVENSRSWQEQLAQHQRSRYVPKRWYIRSLLARDSLELTDCGCLWWST